MPRRSRNTHLIDNLASLVPENIRFQLQTEQDKLNNPSVSEEIKQRSVDEMREILKTNVESGIIFRDDSRCVCKMHDRQCAIYRDIVRDRDCMTIMIAGICCQDWTRYNRNRKCSLGKGTMVYLIFIFEARARKWTKIFIECAAEWQTTAFQQLTDDLGDLYHISLGKVSPIDLGHPQSRDRTFAVLDLKGDGVTPFDFGSFLAHSMRKLCSTGDIYFCLPDDMLAEKKEFFARKALNVDSNASWESLLPGGCLAYLDGYADIRKSKIYSRTKDENLLELSIRYENRLSLPMPDEDYLPAFFADLEQKACGQGRYAETHLPALTKKGTIFSFKEKRWLLGEEALLAQGHNIIFPGCHGNGFFMHPAAEFLRTLSDSKQRMLAGQAMHASVMLEIVVWSLVTTRSFRPGSPPPRTFSTILVEISSDTEVESDSKETETELEARG